LVDCGDPTCEIIARKIVELHKRGVSDAIALSELTIRALGFVEG
jgi:hypothetical protein